MIRTIEKALILIIFLYLDWFQYVFGVHQWIVYAAAALLALLICLDTVQRRTIAVSGIPKIVLTYIFFGIYAFVSGVFLASDKSFFLTAMLQYAEYMFVCYAIYHVSQEDKDMTWLLGILFLSACLCAFQTVFFGKTIRSAAVYVTTMGRSNNPNTLGIVMVLGMMAVLFDYRFIQKHFVAALISVVVFGYVIILTGSRKAFLAIVLLLAGWVINYVVYTLKSGGRFQTKGWKGFLQNAAIVAGIVAALMYVTSSAFSSTSLVSKLLLLIRGGLASSERVPLYEQALVFFRQHPFFGVGFRQYEVLYERHLYSHSTYAEILACTGIVGTLIFFLPIGWLTVKGAQRALARTNVYSYMYRMLYLILGIELFIAATQVAVYDLSHMTLFTFLFWQFDRAEEYRRQTMQAGRIRRRPRMSGKRRMRA